MHAVVSASAPISQKLERSPIDIVFFESMPFIHVIDIAKSWSEVGRLRSWAMSDECNVFIRLWIYRHGPPKLLQADKEHGNIEFQKFCADWEIEVRIVAANHHKANGGIERDNRRCI